MTSATAKNPGPRERLLTAAAELFVREGIGAVGVDRLSERAEVSKRSLYQHFGTKDAVVTAMLETFGPQLVHDYFPSEDAGTPPADRIRGVFVRLAAGAGRPGFTGCPFVNVSTELRASPDHPAVAVARQFKSALTAYFRRALVELDANDPDATAVALTVLFDGASAYGVMYAEGIPAAVLGAVDTLLGAVVGHLNSRVGG